MIGIDEAVWIVEGQVYSEFQRVWWRVVQEEVPDFQVYIWGSVITDEEEPTDLDVIIAYEAEHVGDEKEESIRGWLQDEVYVDEFEHLDPVVTSVEQVEEILDNSRAEQIYCVESKEMVEY